MNHKTAISQAKALIDSSLSDIPNMANLAAFVMTQSNYHWVGFYRVIENKLELGPFQGPVACTTIEHGKGVCGTAWAEKRSLVVPDVHQFPGHIACSALSNSELVVPCIRDGKVFAVLDIDSEKFDAFTHEDVQFFEELAALL